MQDIDVVDMCLRAVDALASYHYKEKTTGKGGLGAHAIDFQGSNGKVQETITRHFLHMLMQALLFEDFRLVMVSILSKIEIIGLQKISRLEVNLDQIIKWLLACQVP